MPALSTSHFSAGYRRLKTTSGCLTCRRRRKKCDELKPLCTACIRNRLECNWPLGKTGVSCKRRTFSTHPSKTTENTLHTRDHKSNGNPSSYQDPANILDVELPQRNFYNLWSTTTPNFEGLQSSVVHYCMDFFLPYQVQNYPGLAHTDQSYIISMSLSYRPLINALIANAALTLRTNSKHWQSFALEKYICAARDVRRGIEDGSLTGREDSLLATVMWLCIFENSRLDGRCSRSVTHLRAFSKLLRLRTPMSRHQSSQSALCCERICVEYYIYHSAIIMLFDPVLDPARDVGQLYEKYSSCFTPCAIGPWRDIVKSPVLGAPHQLFVIIVEATKLARGKRSGDIQASTAAWCLYEKLVEWQLCIDHDACSGRNLWTGRLYALAARILLLRTIFSLDERHLEDEKREISAVASQALTQLSIQPLGVIFGKYWLWPLAVLGSIMTCTEDVSLIRDRMDAIDCRSGCSAIKVVRYILESIWATIMNGRAGDYCMGGLDSLLDDDIMESTSSLLVP